MPLHRLVISSLALILLAGCQTVTPAERRAADEKTCTEFGFRAKTDAMAQCLLDLELDRRARLRSLRDSSDPFYWRTPVVIDRPVYIRRK